MNGSHHLVTVWNPSYASDAMDEHLHNTRDNLLGPGVWSVLEPATRTFLASAEAVFRARAHPRRHKTSANSFACRRFASYS